MTEKFLPNPDQIRNQWLDRYQGKTRKQALNALAAYDKFISERYEQNESKFISIALDPLKKYSMLDDIVQFWNAKGLWPTSIKNYFSFVRSYLKRHGIITDNEGVKDNIKFPKQINELRNPLTIEVIQDVILNANKKYAALFLFLISTGMRIGETLAAQVSWLDFSTQKKYGLIVVKIPALATKGRTERFTFINEQAYKAMKPYLDTKLTPYDPLFDVSYDGIVDYLERLRSELGHTEKYQTGNYKLNVHSFRSFTETILSDYAGEEFAHFILGHEQYLKYYRKNFQQAAALYKKAVPNLLIPDLEVKGKTDENITP